MTVWWIWVKNTQSSFRVKWEDCVVCLPDSFNWEQDSEHFTLLYEKSEKVCSQTIPASRPLVWTNRESAYKNPEVRPFNARTEQKLKEVACVVNRVECCTEFLRANGKDIPDVLFAAMKPVPIYRPESTMVTHVSLRTRPSVIRSLVYDARCYEEELIE